MAAAITGRHPYDGDGVTKANSSSVGEDLLERLKTIEQRIDPQLWAPKVGEFVFFKEHSYQQQECVGRIIEINGMKEWNSSKNSDRVEHLTISWQEKDNVPWGNVWKFSREQFRHASVEDLLARGMKKGMHSFEVGQTVRDIKRDNVVGIVSKVDVNDWNLFVRWRHSPNNEALVYCMDLQLVSIAEVMEESEATVAQLKQKEAALQQEIVDQKARSLSLEERFSYFVQRIEELEKKGEVAQAQIQEIERQELLPVLHTMSKREKIKFLVVQIGKRVGVEVIKKLVKDLGLDLNWVMRLLGM